ncbi:MAG TPA: glycoside hydrolase [Desulfobacteraceae bacterium]|nr:glycoside hydrolase [Desulfobacteraceae bacterium]
MFTKQYLKSKALCRVRFKLYKKQIGSVDKVHLVGEFNDWDEKQKPMKKLKSGDFSAVMDLKPDRAYQFRYLIDDNRWLNDETADAYCPSPFPGVENSVITL